MKFYRQQRSTYWTSSKLAKWLKAQNGVGSPSALTAEGWVEHEKEYKDTAPITHWIVETGFRHSQNVFYFIPDLIHSAIVYCKNVEMNTHVLDGGLNKGQWYDLDYRITHCLFGELVKFIEIEKGLDVHEWEMGLVIDGDFEYEGLDAGQSTPQALAAIEQNEIYCWWKANKDRDFFAEAGYVDKERVSVFDYDEQDREVWRKVGELEKQYEKECEEMLIRLIKIKGSLWT